MGIFGKNKETGKTGITVQTGRSSAHPFAGITGYVPLSNSNTRVYRALVEGVPIIDSAINKIVRLMGGFEFSTGNEALDKELNAFFESINVGGNQIGIQAFADTYMQQLLTFGSAIGEMLYDANGFYALYNGELDTVEIKRKDSSLDFDFYNIASGAPRLIEDSEKILFSVLNPEPGKLLGTSLLRGLPFVSDILLKIYNTIGTNWERVGNVRYAVTYNPKNEAGDKAFAKDRAEQMASAWRDAMSSKDSVKDFVAVGDVKISVIGADNQILDSEVPVRQMLEQIIAKTGLMPYMLGLNWSVSERMAKQQSDILTTELEAYRRIITPVLKKIAASYLALKGTYLNVDVIWDDITLQDEKGLAEARKLNAEADRLIKEVEGE
ncbi:MAG: serine/threonine protein phosphatase [Eubacterium sp.]|nr:serine/threonine protein phosphatase [Eubacterium sp.]